jgi:hypothetical protein
VTLNPTTERLNGRKAVWENKMPWQYTRVFVLHHLYIFYFIILNEVTNTPFYLQDQEQQGIGNIHRYIRYLWKHITRSDIYQKHVHFSRVLSKANTDFPYLGANNDSNFYPIRKKGQKGIIIQKGRYLPKILTIKNK